MSDGRFRFVLLWKPVTVPRFDVAAVERLRHSMIGVLI